MWEVIVILACTQGKGCAEATSAYYNVNPSIKEMIANTERLANKIVLFEYGAPIVGAAINKEVYIKINRNFSTKIQNDTMSIKYIREW